VLQKTRGIVFRFVKYGDTSIITNVFTEQFGLQSYVIKGVRSNAKRSKIALFQPLTLLDMVVYHKESGGIMHMKEVKCFYPYKHLTSDIRKSAIAMFLAEVLNRSVKEQSHTQDIFEYISTSFIDLDNTNHPENFHLLFLLGLSRHLGFGPNLVNEILGGRIVSEKEEAILIELMHADYQSKIVMQYEERQNLLEVLLRFYTSHIDGLGELKSTAVLKEVLS
jgi:DNA repair protein RecO (recombination protein O)